MVPIFNLDGVNDLRIGPDVMADIYLGKISKWDDARIAKDNPGVKLPSQDIFVVHRSDGSGTTFIFTDYLSKVSKDWAGGPGKGASPSWPRGIGAKGNEGVAGFVRQSPGAIGYVELIYALQNKIPFAYVKTAGGSWVKASIEGVSEAAASVKNMPADYRVSITNAPGNCLSHLQFHLASDSKPGQGPRQRQGADRFSQVDAAASERGQLTLLRSASCFGSAEGQCHDQHAQVKQ